MSTSPLLTIAMPTYNREASVARSLKTLLSRSLHCDPASYEILIIDDCSTDRTLLEVETVAAAYPRAPLRVIKNVVRRQLDGNAYFAYQEARGKFLWFCSDRFFYNVDLGLVLGLIAAHPALGAITFSDLLRRVYPVPPERQVALENVQDDAILAKLRGEPRELSGHRYYLTTAAEVIDNGCLYGGAAPLVDATPDVILRVNHTDEWMATYKEFVGSYNMFAAAMFEPLRKRDHQVAFVQNLSFCEYAHRLSYGGNRHNWLACLEYEPVFQRVFDFYPRNRDKAGHRVLFDFYTYQRAERDMTQPVTKEQIEKFCKDRGYQPSVVFSILTWLFERDAPQGYHRALRRLLLGALQLKGRTGLRMR